MQKTSKNMYRMLDVIISTENQVKQSEEEETSGEYIVLKGVAREGFLEQKTFEKRPGEVWALNHVDIWGTTVPSRRTHKCKRSETETGLAYLKNDEEANGTVVPRWTRLVGDEVIKVIG